MMDSSKEMYLPVPSVETASDSDFETAQPHEPSSRSRLRFLGAPLVGAILVLIIVIQAVALFFVSAKSYHTAGTCQSPNGFSLARTEERIVYEHSKYVSEDEAEASAAWNSILPGHGVVLVDPEDAAAQGLPDSMVNTDGSGKFVYVLEAYHVMHCVVNLRAHYTALEQNQHWNWSRAHDLHCFDALRQYIMCNVDDTLLHTWGHRDAGHNQHKMCHDWDRLRTWAEQRSAKYFDVEPGMGVRHSDNYHAGDGLPVGGLS